MRTPNFLAVIFTLISIALAASLSPRIYNPGPGIGLISTDTETYRQLEPRVKRSHCLRWMQECHSGDRCCMAWQCKDSKCRS
ncbi:hypothetical protein BZA77DRAFT_329083 [Pyronema omphalodes]|nr:hypothetical protein BZA77DRAFT_329083 [Pyronema omphalodes]